MPGGGLNASQAFMPGGETLHGGMAGGSDRMMPFPASGARKTWPLFAGYRGFGEWVPDGNGGYYDDSVAADAVPGGSDPTDDGSSSTDEADTSASIAADGETEDSVWSKIQSGALDIFTAAMKYGPGIYVAYTRATSPAATPDQIALAKAQAAAAKKAGAVAPVKTIFTPMNIGLGLLALFAAVKLLK
jgi:hypothetical protein